MDDDEFKMLYGDPEAKEPQGAIKAGTSTSVWTTHAALWDYVTVYLPGGKGGYIVPRDLAEKLIKFIPGAYIG